MILQIITLTLNFVPAQKVKNRGAGGGGTERKNRIVCTRDTVGSFKIIFRNYGKLTKHL
jgi:hypothetical protein